MSYLVSKSQPIKKFPEVLFYKRKVTPLRDFNQIEYVAFATDNSKNWGELILHKSNIQHRLDYKGPTLAIDFIKSNESGKGLGTAMINFAKNYSKKNGCNGYIILCADSIFSPKRIPHIFYRKQGFSTLNNKIDPKMDKFIKNNLYATDSDFSRKTMYFPPRNRNILEQKSSSLLEVCRNLIQKLCNFTKIHKQ